MATKTKTSTAPRKGTGAGVPPPAGQVAGANNPNIYSGYLATGVPFFRVGGKTILENPDPIAATESQGRGSAVYDDMLDKDPHIAGIWDTRVTAVTSLQWEIIAANDTPKAKAMAELVTRVFNRIEDLEESLGQLLMGVVAGYQVAEIEWLPLEDGTWGILRLHDRLRDTFLFDSDWNPRLKTMGSLAEGEELPDRKFIVYRHKPQAYNPYGVGIGRALWWAHWFKKNGLTFWLIFLEKFGLPTVIGKHAPNMSKPKRDEFLRILKSVQTESAITVSEDLAVDLLEASRSGAASYADACEYLDDLCTKRVLGQTLTTDAKPTGIGGGAATEQGFVREDIRCRDALSLAKVVTRTAVRWVVDANYGPQAHEDYPRFHIPAEEPEDLGSAVELVDKLVEMGLPVEVDYVYERFGIPQPKAGAKLINELKARQARESMPAGLGGPGEPGDDEPLNDNGDDDE